MSVLGNLTGWVDIMYANRSVLQKLPHKVHISKCGLDGRLPPPRTFIRGSAQHVRNHVRKVVPQAIAELLSHRSIAGKQPPRISGTLLELTDMFQST